GPRRERERKGAAEPAPEARPDGAAPRPGAPRIPATGAPEAQGDPRAGIRAGRRRREPEGREVGCDRPNEQGPRGREAGARRRTGCHGGPKDPEEREDGVREPELGRGREA